MSSAEEDQPISEEKLAVALERLAIFPLPGVVLFPCGVLPLHVFEPRYRKMTRHVLTGSRLLAIAQLVSGTTDQGKSAVHAVAGVGEVVMAQELPDGRFHILLRGRARVRIASELTTTEPYRVVRA